MGPRATFLDRSEFYQRLERSRARRAAENQGLSALLPPGSLRGKATCARCHRSKDMRWWRTTTGSYLLVQMHDGVATRHECKNRPVSKSLAQRSWRLGRSPSDYG